MRFKRLELLGFKTFADSTEFHFEPGITAIVGPNGAGKSNVADAIKWVLGEQSARELRGGRMEDLIFNGSDRREPVNYAEVSLTLDNVDHRLPVDYSEVTISRRLYRSGESEYLLNRTPVRLKDICELLMGTGIGTSAYSLFEQGRIEQIISARPEERRAVFEEAAGITKFKSQKREALRKLDETEANLLRVADITAEVKRQIQALERQVKRARVYQEQFEKLKGLEVRVARHEKGKLSQRFQERQGVLQGLQAEADGLRERLNSEEGRLAQARAAVSRQDDILHQTRQQLLTVTHRQESARSNAALTRERIAESQGRRSQAQEELFQLETQVEQLGGQLQELERTVREAEDLRRSKEEECIQIQRSLEACSGSVEEAKEAIAATQERLLEESTQEAGLKNEFSKVRQEHMRVDARWNRLAMETAKVAAEFLQAQGHLQELEGAQREIEGVVALIDGERSQGFEKLSVLQTACTALQEKVNGLEKERARFSSQFEFLKGMLASHEGYDSGVKALLTALDQGVLDRDGVNGVLAELIQVALPETAAADAALGSFAQAVVVESVACANRCREFLETNKAGRVLFLIRDQVPLIPSFSLSGGEGKVEGGIPLIDRVGITPHLEPLLQLLLADTWLISSTQAAQVQPAAGLRFVTPSGELFTVTSALLGSAPLKDALVVGRRSRLESLEVTCSHLETETERVRDQFSKLEEERRAQETQVHILEEQLREKRHEMERSHGTFASAQQHFKKLEEEKALLSIEEKEVRQELEELRVSLSALQEGLAAKEGELSELQAAIGEFREEITHQSQLREELSVKLASLTAELASFDQVTESRRASLQVMQESLSSAGAQVAARREEMKRLEQQELKWEAMCRELEALVGQLELEKTGAAAEVSKTEGERHEALSRAEQEEKEFQTLSRRAACLEQKLHEEEMEQTKLGFEREQITSRLQQVYQVNLEEVLAAEAVVLLIATDEELTQVRDEIAELSVKLQRIGPVNLGSIEEERELQLRYEHLVTQQNDLLKAKDDLHEALTKINRTTRALFRETFEAIQREFQIAFKQLFGGGEARLVLLDEEDLLESGIEIIARPPGKAIQAISLLSGGEKSLTAIALLFAIFRIKPSPFCLMDEIDAPLDETNIGRFTNALREFLKDSQFIIITHNKKTISMADVMYGITMQELGVSKIVSVKLKDNGGPPKEAAPASLQPATSSPTTAPPQG